MGYPAGELLVLGWELRFQALCHSSTVLGAFKGPKFMPLQIHGLTLEFEVHASKRRLRWEKKNNIRHVH